MMTRQAVYRAPMRSRDDLVAEGAAVERALTLGLCGMGERAVDAGDAERGRRRLARFIAAPDGSFVWTRDIDGMLWLGRLAGPARHDDSGPAREVDLVHVRPCRWLDAPTEPSRIPAAVRATFARGGRNWQEIHDRDVWRQTEECWSRGSQ